MAFDDTFELFSRRLKIFEMDLPELARYNTQQGVQNIYEKTGRCLFLYQYK